MDPLVLTVLTLLECPHFMKTFSVCNYYMKTSGFVSVFSDQRPHSDVLTSSWKLWTLQKTFYTLRQIESAEHRVLMCPSVVYTLRGHCEKQLVQLLMRELIRLD